MGFEKEASLAEALHKAEKDAARANQEPSLTAALELAYAEANAPSVLEVWRSFEESGASDEQLRGGRRPAEVEVEVEEFADPQAVGHALVTASVGGYMRCVQRLREIQDESLSGSMLVGLFNAFALLKAAEAGKTDVVEELLQRQISASMALMGYMVATRWKDTKGTEAYPYIEQPNNVPSAEWMRKLVTAKASLPAAGPKYKSTRGWDVGGLPGLHENLHELVRASYRTFLLWRVSVVAASRCNAEVFRILLERRSLDNAALAKSIEAMESRFFDQEAKKIMADRAKIDTLMYQLVEEYSTKNFHDAMLYTLWGHIQRSGRNHPAGPGAGNPQCVAQAQNGIWEMALEVPLLMMPVEYAMEDEEPFRRYKQLTLLFNQRSKVNIQLIANVESLSNCLQVTVGVKHVRFKAENSRWDEECMGHFPTAVTLSVMPQSKDGTNVTMTNSSSNNTYKIGRGENFAAGTGGGDGATRGLAAALRISAGVSMHNTVKSTPWRFEQLPLVDDRGGSFVWTLQAMKGLAFDRANPHRMSETNSTWKWGRRVPGNPLDQLPFTSEGGVAFTGTEFADTMMWRFPKSMEGKKLRWNIQGQIHSTFTTCRYFETRVASFSGDIEEPLKPLEDKKDKDKDKDKSDKGGEKSEKKEKEKSEDKEDGTKKALAKLDTTTRTEFEQWLEFKKYRDEKKKGAGTIREIPSASTPPREDAEITPVVEDETEGAALMVMKLDLDDGNAQTLSNRPSLTRIQGYNGRWLGNPDMESVSISSASPVEEISNGGFLSPPRMPALTDIMEDSDAQRSSRRGRILEREQQIKGLSVRSSRKTRSSTLDVR